MHGTGTEKYLASGLAKTDRVTPAKAGIQPNRTSPTNFALDTSLRWYDGVHKQL